jgi:SPP1 gp7 family putative phage head morphogenesis protein
VGYFIDTEGATLGDAIDRLGAAFDEARAMTIATTEITQAYAAGQEDAADELYEAYPELNIVKTWYTVSDEITCPICGPLHGMTIERNEPYGYDVFDNELMSPPAHPNCRCDITYEVA